MMPAFDISRYYLCRFEERFIFSAAPSYATLMPPLRATPRLFDSLRLTRRCRRLLRDLPLLLMPPIIFDCRCHAASPAPLLMPLRCHDVIGTPATDTFAVTPRADFDAAATR